MFHHHLLAPCFRAAIAALSLTISLDAQCALQDDSLPEASALLDAADAKIAAPAARANLKSLRAKGTLEAMGMKCSVEELFVGVDRASIKMVVPGMSAMTMGLEPRFAWTTDPAMGILTVVDDDAAPMRHLMGHYRRASWRELYKSAKTVGAETIEEQACWKIELTAAAEPKEHIYLLKSEGLPLCVDLALPDFQEGTLPMRFFFQDWKRVDDILFPHTRRQVIGNYDLATKFTSFELGQPIEADEIAAPAEVVKHWQEEGSSKRTTAMAAGECRVEEQPERHALAVRLEIEEQDIAKTLAIVLPEIVGYLGELGVTPSGPPYSRYHRRANGKIEMEGGIPVREAQIGKGRVLPVVLPKGPAAVSWHHGSYHELAQTYALLEAWMKAQKLRSGGPYFEIYWTDPGLEPDPKKWRTQVIWPIAK